MNGLAGKVLFGGILGLALSFLLANYLSIGLLSVYGDWLGWRQVTGSAPNMLTAVTQKITWAIFFCASWVMFWKFDSFFLLRPKDSIDQKNSNRPEPGFEEKKQDVEYFKPERDVEKTDSSSESEPKPESEPEPEPEPKPVLSEEDRIYAEILGLKENAIEDFDTIKTLYRKRIAQYHPDKVLAMGPEIREVAEQKAKEINEAHEYFRIKFKKDHTK
tara:strand:- start:2086 stop:2736 length:651 start_codon:yes stop_codon:yes gene_type:complete